jgi:hypothetical protein
MREGGERCKLVLRQERLEVETGEMEVEPFKVVEQSLLIRLNN